MVPICTANGRNIMRGFFQKLNKEMKYKTKIYYFVLHFEVEVDIN